MFDFREKKEMREFEGAGIDIGDRLYNFLIGVVLLYGFIVNAIMVQFAGPLVAGIKPWILIVGYLVLCITGSLMVNLSESSIISFIGYNFIVVPLGALLSVCLPNYDSKHIFMAIQISR